MSIAARDLLNSPLEVTNAWIGLGRGATTLPFREPHIGSPGWLRVRRGRFTSTVVGDLVSWSVDAHGHVFPANGGAAAEEYPHVVVDRDGVEWTVREVATPQSWARASRCLVLSSRECVRRIWHYPPGWRSMDADALLAVGRAD